MGLIEKFKSILLPNDDAEIESLHRRMFLRGLTITAAGLVLPLPTIVIPHAGLLLSSKRQAMLLYAQTWSDFYLGHAYAYEIVLGWMGAHGLAKYIDFPLPCPTSNSTAPSSVTAARR